MQCPFQALGGPARSAGAAPVPAGRRAALPLRRPRTAAAPGASSGQLRQRRRCCTPADFDAEAVVVGAGVVGLAAARALALGGCRDVIVIEREYRFGMGQSSRNSEVVHAGIYYQPGSAKARLCVAGRKKLYAFCESHHVPCKKLGKLIVATSPGQLSRLDGIAATAARNGVELQRYSASETAAAEPCLGPGVLGSLWSPETGIVCTHEFMGAMLGDLENAGGTVAYRSDFAGAEPLAGGGFRVSVRDEEGAESDLRCRFLVNAAGIHASKVALAVCGVRAETVPTTHLAKGRYFSFSGKHKFRHLVYPVPEEGGLGVHATLDLGGGLRFGPDVEWVSNEDYTVQPEAADKFYAAIRQYWPELPDRSLLPAYAGLRAKIGGRDGRETADFLIQGESAHGVPGLVNCLGIESPGVTSALAIADDVAGLLTGRAAAA